MWSAKFTVNKEWKSFEKGFQRELVTTVKGQMKKYVIETLKKSQKDFVNRLPDHEAGYMPFITGNLHDSIASVVSDNGRVVRAVYPTAVATQKSTRTGKTIYASNTFNGKRVIGALEASNAVRNMQGRFPKGIGATLLVGVPYALEPHEKGPHEGYMNSLLFLYSRCVDSAFTAGQALGYWRWKGGFNMPLEYMEVIANTEMDADYPTSSFRRGSSSSAMSPRLGLRK